MYTETKSSRCEAVILALHRIKVQMSTLFLRDKTLNYCTRVYYAPAEPCTNVFFFCVGSAGSLSKPQISQKVKKPKSLTKKKPKKKNEKMIVKGSAGAHETRAQNSRVFNLSKMAWTLGSEGIWDDNLEPACMNSTCFLGWICTPQILHDLSQRQAGN